jgi:histidinol phosphatase-like enzyme
MYNALFVDIPNLIKTKSKQAFPIHREDWTLTPQLKEVIKTYSSKGYKICLLGNYSDIPIRKHEPNPINNLYENIASTLEKELKLETNSIVYEYATDRESFDYLPLPGLFYNLASEHEILLSYSYIITVPHLGEFIQIYSSVKPIFM